MGGARDRSRAWPHPDRASPVRALPGAQTRAAEDLPGLPQEGWSRMRSTRGTVLGCRRGKVRRLRPRASWRYQSAPGLSRSRRRCPEAMNPMKKWKLLPGKVVQKEGPQEEIKGSPVENVVASGKLSSWAAGQLGSCGDGQLNSWAAGQLDC